MLSNELLCKLNVDDADVNVNSESLQVNLCKSHARTLTERHGVVDQFKRGILELFDTSNDDVHRTLEQVDLHPITHSNVFHNMVGELTRDVKSEVSSSGKSE